MSKSVSIVSIAAVAVLVSAGSAYAYWTVPGAGSSTVSVAEIKPLEVDAAEIKNLVIGIAKPITGEVKNPNDFEVSLLDTHITVKVTVDKAHHECGPENFRVEAPTTKAKTIAAKGTAPFKDGSIKMVDTGRNQVACQGAILTLDYLLK